MPQGRRAKKRQESQRWLHNVAIQVRGSAIGVLKQLGSDVKNVKLLAAIYGITPHEVMELLAE